MRVELQLRGEGFIRQYREVEALSLRGGGIVSKGLLRLDKEDPVEHIEVYMDHVDSLYVFDGDE